jgi:hypothetical protein
MQRNPQRGAGRPRMLQESDNPRVFSHLLCLQRVTSLARRGGKRRTRRRVGGEVRGGCWPGECPGGGVESAQEIGEVREEALIRADSVQLHGRRSRLTATTAASSKQQRSTRSSSHTTTELRPSSSESQPLARYPSPFSRKSRSVRGSL